MRECCPPKAQAPIECPDPCQMAKWLLTQYPLVVAGKSTQRVRYENRELWYHPGNVAAMRDLYEAMRAVCGDPSLPPLTAPTPARQMTRPFYHGDLCRRCYQQSCCCG